MLPFVREDDIANQHNKMLFVAFPVTVFCLSLSILKALLLVTREIRSLSVCIDGYMNFFLSSIWVSVDE